MIQKPNLVAVSSEAQACRRLMGEFAGLNPGESMDVRIWCLLRILQVAASASRLSLAQNSSTVRACVLVYVCVCIMACDLETSRSRCPRKDLGSNGTGKK